MQNVIDFCKENGGRITSGEVAHQANLAGHFGNGPNLITQLRASRKVTVEVIGVEDGLRGNTRNVYRITERKS